MLARSFVALACSLVMAAPVDGAPAPTGDEDERGDRTAPQSAATGEEAAPEDAEGEAEGDSVPDAAPEAEGEGAPPDGMDPAERSSWWYRRGIELGQKGEFVAAASAFERSYEAHPTPEALVNAARAYEYAGRPIEAIDAFRRHIEEAGRNDPLGDTSREAADRLLREVGEITAVEFSPGRKPVQILVDDKRYTLDEFPLLVMPGSLSVAVVDETGARQVQTLAIGPGERKVIDLRLSGPRPEFLPPPDIGTSGGVPQKTKRALFYSSAGLLGASAIALGTFGGLTLRERDAWEDASCDGMCPEGTESPEDHLRNFQTFRTTTNVMWGVTGVFALTTLVLGVVAFTGRDAKGAKDDTQVDAHARGLRVRF